MKTLLHSLRHSFSARLGFTVVEMSIAMTITGLFSAIAIPSIVSQEPSRKLNRMVWQLNAELRAARTQAMSESCAMNVAYDRVQRVFTFWSDTDGDGLRDVNEVKNCEMESGSDFRIYTYPSELSARFLPNGSFQTDNRSSSLVLITLSSAGAKNNYYLYVWPSGQVTVFKYANYSI